MLPAIDRLLGRTTGEGDEFRDGARVTAEFQFRQLQRLPSVPGRKFVFAHILLPASAVRVRPRATWWSRRTAEAQPEAELYADQLGIRELAGRADRSTRCWRDRAESDPIIIIMGDEGRSCAATSTASTPPCGDRDPLASAAYDLPDQRPASSRRTAPT